MPGGGGHAPAAMADSGVGVACCGCRKPSLDQTEETAASAWGGKWGMVRFRFEGDGDALVFLSYLTALAARCVARALIL